MRVRVLTLLYGDHFDLHARLIGGLQAIPPHLDYSIILWCNQVGDRTRALVERFVSRSIAFNAVFSEENVRKYEVMRRLMRHDPLPPPLGTTNNWWLWLDDDVKFLSPDWFRAALKYIDSKRAENICYVGEPWFVPYLPGQLEFIKASTWYKGLPPLTKARPVIEFAQGSFWWLRADVAKEIGWPDPRLEHNGGDTLLGEAIRQQGLPFHKFHAWVKPNAAPRRGLSERPAGSTVDTRR